MRFGSAFLIKIGGYVEDIFDNFNIFVLLWTNNTALNFGTFYSNKEKYNLF